ncbi:MAG: methylated-DNA--[protein]-cysteine S-methyltransferase [Sporichthyaceae bacterium]|nr:methylated-DNA--[protein]-cysteine S-methyltransferase [Sporichthyaceae bacterium]
MADLEWGTLDTQFGRVHVATSPEGLARVYLPSERRPAGVPATGAIEPSGPVAAVLSELTDYFTGVRTAFRVPIDWSVVNGFRAEVLKSLYDRIGWGQVTTYGELATAVGAPDAARAVGEVMASNPIPIVVPCHRVLASRGAIGGFGGGIELKRALLALEGVLPAPLEFDP